MIDSAGIRASATYEIKFSQNPNQIVSLGSDVSTTPLSLPLFDKNLDLTVSTANSGSYVWIEYFDESLNDYFPLTDKLKMSNVLQRFEGVKVPLLTNPNYLKLRAVVIDEKNMFSATLFPDSVP